MRETKIGLALLKLLEVTSKPISVPEILEILEKQSLLPNKTTIYRQLEQLQKQSKVSAITLKSGTIHYEFKKNHHHHFICDSCGDIMCLNKIENSEDICKAIQKLTAPGVQIKSHEFNLYGDCEKCLNASDV